MYINTEWTYERYLNKKIWIGLIIKRKQLCVFGIHNYRDPFILSIDIIDIIQ